MPTPSPNQSSSSNQKEIIIEARSVSKFFIVKSQSVEILRGIDLTIHKGEFMALFGPSGCGKSTLLHIVLGLEKPNTGVVMCKGQELYLLNEDNRAKLRKKTMGMIYQQSNWIKSLSVIENVAFMGSLLGYPRAHAFALARDQLKNVGMLEWADYRPTELSSGQQQKVSLARALLNNPDIIIADEPTGNLDYRSGVELMKQFSALAAAGKTILMVTHNIDNVEYTTQVIQMFDGKLVGVNKTKEEDIKKLKLQIIENISQAQSRSQSTAGETSTTSTFTTQKGVVITKKKFPLPSVAHIHPLKAVKEFTAEVFHLFRFSGYLFYFFVTRGIDAIRVRLTRVAPFLKSKDMVEPVSVQALSSIHPSDLIEIALKNMFAKKTRTLVTIGGMAIGICLIVFLISIGYGLEQLVISRVARLDETKQTDVSPVAASNILLTDKVIADIKALPNVARVLPVVGVVGKIRSKSATTDVAVYGVSPEYLKESAIKPVYGAVFGDTTLSDSKNTHKNNIVATGEGALTSVGNSDVPELGAVIRAIEYQGDGVYVRVREKPDSDSRILGYTKTATTSGSLVWGKGYEEDKTYGMAYQSTDKSESFGYWIQDDFPLWREATCDGECSPDSLYEPSKDLRGNQKTKQGYIAIIGLQTDFDPSEEQVSLLASQNPSPTQPLEATDQASLVEKQLKELTLVASNINTKEIELPNDRKRYAYVNTTLLDVLGLDPKKAPGTIIELALVATDTSRNNKVETNYLPYTITGVTSESKTPILYTPIAETRELELPYYSQAKVIVTSRDKLGHIREQIGALGLKTTSVVDTIAQIEKLFASVRTLLGVLGVVALSVAALGMFNTLTVSMLERTHEVGMMKAVGMVSKEVKELFLAESMIMGILGGIVGLILGILAGRLLSLVLSFVSISKGAGFMSVSSLPMDFIILIVVLSLIVGFVTGMYPASRATRISALDALRYE